MKASGALVAAAGLVLLGLPSGSTAHTTATGLATITVSGATVGYRLTLLLGELPAEPARLLAAAADRDQTSVARVAEELRRRITLRAGEAPCRAGRALIQALALLGFNLGVEAGQTLGVLLLLPVLLWMRGRKWQPAAVRVASLGVAVVGVGWLVQRLFFA
jgi:hypothetical protein